MSFLSDKERERYTRQIIMPEVGDEGQAKLKNASVLCVGAGGLGSPVLYYLTAAGIGKIGIVDHDVLSESNLQRQILHGSKDLGMNKAINARKRLLELNPAQRLDIFDTRLSEANSAQIIEGYDLVIDACDNYATRFIINKACIKNKIPMIYGAISGFIGQVSVFYPAGGTPCYRCLIPGEPATSAEPIGVIGATPGVTGSLQAAEAIKWILGAGTPLTGKLLTMDLLQATSRIIQIKKDPCCPDCS